MVTTVSASSRTRSAYACAPAVIFGSDGLDGCAHAAFEILSNAVDEARQGYGNLIPLTAFAMALSR